MKRTLLAIMLTGCVSTAWGQDFLEMLKKVMPQIPAALTAPATPVTPAKTPTTPQTPGQLTQALGGLFGETSNEEEVIVGKQLAGNLLGAVQLVEDEKLQTYVNKVGRWVASQTDRADLNWYFGVVDTSDINAFALPGGYVFITKGLYGKLSSEAELAGALGHEIGHVIMQHHFKVLKQSQMVSAASGLMGRGIGKDGIGNAAVQNLLGNGAEALARGLDKDAEFEADRIGVVLATRAGYSPYGLPSVLQKIGRPGATDSSMALLFKTHPSPQDRLSRLGDAMTDSFDRYEDGKALSERLYAVAGQSIVVATPTPAPSLQPKSLQAPATPSPVAAPPAPTSTTATTAAVAPPTPAPQSPEEFCADRGNFISRNLCISRDCERPEKKDLPFCQARRANN